MKKDPVSLGSHLLAQSRLSSGNYYQAVAKFSARFHWPDDATRHRKRVYRTLQFQKRSQLFIRTHEESLSVAAIRIATSSEMINRIDPGCALRLSDYHADRLLSGPNSFGLL